MSTAAILDAFAQLQTSQQIQLVEDLWDRIAESPEPPPLTAAQAEELRRRKAASAGGPPAGRSWEEVRKGLLESDGR
jgi:putative addiction module component (TIGR02574 family)